MKFWNYLKGKKRNIGIILLILLRITTTIKPELIPYKLEDALQWGIDGLLVGGSVDAYRRGGLKRDKEAARQLINKFKIK